MMKKQYYNVNLRTLRKCPACGSPFFRKTIWSAIVTVKDQQGVRRYPTYDEAGDTFECFGTLCGITIYQDGSVEK